MPWKLYLDSRRRVRGTRGDTDTDFAVQMPYPITVSGKCFVDVCLVGNSFYTIRADCDRIYLVEDSPTQSLMPRVAFLAHGQYSVYELRDQIVIALNTNKIITGQYACTYVTATNRYVISMLNGVLGDSFTIWMEEGLRGVGTSWFAIPLPGGEPKSANRACGLLDGMSLDGTYIAPVIAPNAPDVQPYKQLFLRSNLGGGSAESLGVNGESDIIRRIVVGNTPVNAVIHDVHSNALDCVTINGKPEFTQLWFQLVDVDGKVVDTHGLPISFSIIFVSLDE